MIAMGVDVGGTNLRVGAVNYEGELLFSFKEDTPTDATTDTLMEILIRMVHRVQSQVESQYNQPLQGLGLGWPGAVRKEEGLVLETPNIKGFEHFPLKARLEQALNIRCEIENDANCAGLAEKYFGTAKNFKNFILLTFGTGIGGVLFMNSQLLRGHSGLAGEIGHMCLYPGGLLCGCGSRGCLEKYVSAKALESRALEKWKRGYSAREILALSDNDANSDATQLIKEYVFDLSLALGSLMNIFDPEAFVFSGGLFTSGGVPILKELKIQLMAQGYQSIKKNITCVASSLEGKAGIIGAASLLFPR